MMCFFLSLNFSFAFFYHVSFIVFSFFFFIIIIAMWPFIVCSIQYVVVSLAVMRTASSSFAVCQSLIKTSSSSSSFPAAADGVLGAGAVSFSSNSIASIK